MYNKYNTYKLDIYRRVFRNGRNRITTCKKRLSSIISSTSRRLEYSRTFSNELYHFISIINCRAFVVFTHHQQQEISTNFFPKHIAVNSSFEFQSQIYQHFQPASTELLRCDKSHTYIRYFRVHVNRCARRLSLDENIFFFSFVCLTGKNWLHLISIGFIAE